MAKEVVITRVFNAPQELVWDTWTKTEHMLQWWAPEGMTTPHVESDLREGGAYAITMAYDEVPPRLVTVRGRYKTIQKPTKLAFTWKWDDDDLETEVTVSFRALPGDQTELTLIHAGFKDQERETVADVQKGITHEGHSGGWTTGFNKLEKYLATQKR